jgi:hypothetical protein
MKQSSKIARVDDMELFFSMTTSEHTANMTKVAIQELIGRFFNIRPTFRTLPHRIITSSALSNNLRGVSFNNYAELQNWLDEFFTAEPGDFFKQGNENQPKCWEAVVSN